MDAGDRHQEAGHQADGQAEQETCRERQGDPQRQSRTARVWRHLRGQHPGHQERGLVGGGDDGEVQPAGNERDGHGERQDAQFRQLEHHRLQRRRMREACRQQHREQPGQRGKEQDEPADIRRSSTQGGDGPVKLNGKAWRRSFPLRRRPIHRRRPCRDA